MMRKKRRKNQWEPKEVTTQYKKIRQDDFEQRLDELAEVLYQYLYQLEKNSTCLNSNPLHEEERAGA
jgi:hypothetical protein